jgi:hypothetical protein
VAIGRDGSGLGSTGYLFVRRVNGDSTIVPERHQVGCHRDLELVRLDLVAGPTDGSTAARPDRPALPKQVIGELSRSAQRGDRLLHELEPLDPPQPE